ncbi:uncharacterized protein LOC113507480 [Trichoplusia ni]|uniref:Uncharacterized protein LOC113507480 n=1 Tax=Trichoplusia ni TaxID=7111 RepID=A0A7E5WZ30_TRINI|nr:uncharacterized protein LOC113507480 [Trichoplusia ni]
MTAVKGVKDGKALGPGEIPGEVWKVLKYEGYVWLTLFFNKLLHEEDIPQEWCTSSQVPIFKNKGRGTIDAIFALRQLCAKNRRAHKTLHMLFIDLEKAYDRVPREVLWWAMKEKCVPGKVGIKPDIQEEAPWCMLFADDIVLVGENGPEIQSRLEVWQQKLESVGLKISRTKTEYMFCDFGGLSSPEAIKLDGVRLPVCSDFRYLGSFIQSDGEIDRAVKHRSNAGWMKWWQVTGTICDPHIPLKFKGKIYKTIVRPAVLYESECWATKGMNE